MESFESVLKDKSLTKTQESILEAILFLIRKGELPTVREVGALVGLRSPATVLKHLRILEQAQLISRSSKSRGIRIADDDLLRWLFSTGSEASAGSPEASEAPNADLSSETVESGIRESGIRESGESGSSTKRRSTEGDSEILHVHLAQSSRRGATLRLEARPRSGKITLAGAIAAGQPFESYAEGFLSDSFCQDPLDNNSVSTGQQSLPIDPHLFASGGELFALRIEGDSMMRAGILDGDYVIVRRQNSVEEGEIAAVLIDGEGTLKRWTTRTGDGNDGPGTGSKTLRLLPENERFEPIEVHEDEAKDVLVLGKYIGLVRGDLQIA